MTIAEIRDLVIRNQVYLERLKAGSTKDFNRVYGGIEARIRSLMSALDVDNLGQVSRADIERLIRKLEEAALEYGVKAVDQLGSRMEKYAMQAAGFEAAAIAEAVTSKVARTTAEKIMKRVLANPIPLSKDRAIPLGTLFDNFKTTEVKRLGESVRMSWLRGETLQQATRRVVGSAAANYEDGVLAVSRRNGAAVVHTSLQHVSSEARFATYEENDDFIIGYRIVATLDVSTTAVCRSLDGQLFLNKDTGPKPKPPLHVNCRSTTEPELDDDFAFLDEGATRSSREGYTSARTTYYDWLKRQSASEQADILGKAKAKLFRDGGLTVEQFRALQLDKTFQPITLDEMRKKVPKAFKKAGLN